MVDAGAARFLWHCAATLQGWEHLHSNSCNPLPAHDDSEPKTKGLQSHLAEQPFYFGFLGTEMGERANTALPKNISPPSTWPPAPLTFILFNSHFLNLFRFFCPFIPPSLKGKLALKTAKNYEQPQRKHFFSRSTVPKSEQTQKHRGTRDILIYSKYSMD